MIHSSTYPFTLFAVCALASWLATRAVLIWLERRAIYDTPNERSSHTRPTPRGGGIAVIGVVLVAIFGTATLASFTSTHVWIVLGGTAALAALSWLDDLFDLSPALRLPAHAVVVAFALFTLPADAAIFQGLLPPLLDRVLAALLWIWFVNLFNFMDGIDGITGVESAALGGGVFLMFWLLPGAMILEGYFGLAVAGAALGFLLWNWHPARIFLGDVGSVPLGFLLGWLLLELAVEGHWAAALILPLYYLADATITLIRRALRGEKIWRAHREHFYQRAVQRGLTHDAVSLRIAFANILLVAFAAWSLHDREVMALLGAAVVVAALLAVLVRGAPAAR